MILSRRWLLALALAVLAAALALACSDDDDDAAAEPTASAASSTATATATPTAAAPSGPNDELVFRFEQWDATLTIPAGALPEGVSAEDVSASPIELLDPEPDTLPVLAAFELLPDGIELSEPATLEFTVPLGPDRALVAALLDGDRSLLPLGVADEGDGSFSFERLDGISVRVTATVPHFSTWWFYEGQRAIRFDPQPLALSYQVGSSFSVSTAITRLEHTIRYGGGGDFESLTGRFADEDETREIPEFVFSGGEVASWAISSRAFWQTIGPVSIVSFSAGPDHELSDTDRVAELTATVECDAVGTFAISVSPSISLTWGGYDMSWRRSPQEELVPLRLLPSARFLTFPHGEPVFWESECVAQPLPTVTVTPVTTAPEDDDPPEDPTEQPPEQPSDPASKLKQLGLELHNKTLAFSAAFSNGTCSRYPPSYTQTADDRLPEPERAHAAAGSARQQRHAELRYGVREAGRARHRALRDGVRHP